MKEILDKILSYEDQDEAWDLLGLDETVELIRSKPNVDWSKNPDKIVENKPIVVSRLLEAAFFAKDDSLVWIISSIALICSDENIVDIFYLIGENMAAKLSEDILRVILTRMEAQNSPLRESSTYKEIVHRIQRHLSDSDK